MDTDRRMSTETLGFMGFDNRSVPVVDLEKRRDLISEEETANLSTAAGGDCHEPGGKTPILSDMGKSYSVAEAEGHPILIDFEKICEWDHDGDLKVGIRMEDPDYMKKRLLEWVHAVAAYARFLHAYSDIS